MYIDFNITWILIKQLLVYLREDRPVPDIIQVVRHVVNHRLPELPELLAARHAHAAASA